MSTVSCSLPNKPGDDADLGHLVPPRDQMKGVAKLMWVLGSLLLTVNVAVEDKHGGLTVSISVMNVLVMLLATLMLTKGIRDRFWPLVVPWIVLSLYQSYACQYLDILKIFYLLLTRETNRLLWLTWFCYVAALGLRLQLIIQVAFLSINQWYCKKLLNELLTRS